MQVFYLASLDTVYLNFNTHFTTGIFIGLMLVFGRLYVDHEMAVLNGSGVSRHQLARLLIPMTLVYMVCQSVLMLWMTPWGLREFEN